MHVLLVTLGTDGDVFPYIGLGSKLRTRGVAVTLAASSNYESLARSHGFEFCSLVSAEENDELFGHPDLWHPRKAPPLMARWGTRFLQRQYDLLAGRVTSDCLIVANPGVLPALLVHEKLGVPLVHLLLQPWAIPSAIAPPVMPGFLFLRRAPRFMWKLFWHMLDLLVDTLVAGKLNVVRRAIGLKPTRRVFRNWLSPQLVLGLFSGWFGPPQADWPPQLQLLDFPMFDGGGHAELSPELSEFCRAGDRPIAFTFGTGMAHSEHLFRSALEACTLLGIRGIFLTKHRDQIPKPLPPTIVHASFAPFRKLFPECAAVVHHGGIGTTARAMACGVPQVICPLCFDQIDNAVRINALGTGNWIRTRPPTGAQMAAAITKVLTSEARARCGEISSRFPNYDALDSAAELLIKWSGSRKAAT
jgi:rhamnosyltransferase subunit B